MRSRCNDGDWALPLRQGPEAMLVYLGAGADVDGPNPSDVEALQIAETAQAAQFLPVVFVLQ
jgi:hypothetical protein